MARDTSLNNESRMCALCRRPLNLDESVNEEDESNSYMDSNYFRMLADANIALSRHTSLQADTGPQIQAHSPLGSPTSSSRASLDFDMQPNSSREDSNNIRGSNTHAPSAAHLSHDALNQGYYERFFMEQKKLGRGFRGSVFLCQHVLDGIHLGEYAIKKVAVGDNHDWLVQMLREVHLLERLHHPNIVAYKHAWLENHQLHKFGPEVTCLFILMECANGGNLEEYIERPPDITRSIDPEGLAGPASGSTMAESSHSHDPKIPLSALERLQCKRQRLQGTLHSPAVKSGESGTADQDLANLHPLRHLSITEIWSFFFDICEGLAHLHRLGIIHRDLKPPNLLLSYSNSQVKGIKGERPRILITDFGECEILDQAAKRDRTGATGTLEFLAPELLAVDANGRYTDEFSFKGDMWSLGMVLYYLCYSRLPYSQIEDVDILRKEIRQFKSIVIPDDNEAGGRIVPEELKILIRVLLSPEKSKRPSCDDILSTLSHQRDRMMHGDMDSPTTPIRASTDKSSDDPATAWTETLLRARANEAPEADESKYTKGASTATLSRQQLSKNRSGINLQHSHRQPFPVQRRHSATIPATGGRRSSRTGPVPETGPTASLRRRAKPLGLGLRHMMRRRMMHPVSNGIGPLIKSPPLQIGAAGFGQHHRDMLKAQEFQDRKQAARGKESALGHATESSQLEVGEDNITSQDQHFPAAGPYRKPGHDINKAESTGARPQSSRFVDSKATRHDGVKEQVRTVASRPGFIRPDGESSADSTDSINKATKNNVLASSCRPLSKGYWAKLASAHAHEQSRPTMATTDTSAAHAGEESSDGDLTTSSVAGVVGRATVGEQAGAGPRRHRRTSYSRRTRPVSQHTHQTVEQSRRRPSYDQHLQVGLTQRHATPRHGHHQQLSSQQPGKQQFLSEHFSVHVMFASLIFRVWFCLSICNPFMVRPLVLYPVLVLTVIWDRYLLSLISEKFQDTASSLSSLSARHDTARRRSLQGVGAMTASGATLMEEQDNQHVLRSRRSHRQSTIGTDEEDSSDNEASAQVSDGALVLEEKQQASSGRHYHHDYQLRRHGLVDERQAPVVPIWQAFVSGIAIQLLWIGGIWLLSRDGLCVVP
ncbi:putative serine/threonine-protein kinase iks1 [Mortierella claussenii]|nr:putative serine/threonine-protein kinase iks1 [Mortierella claussenii]